DLNVNAAIDPVSRVILLEGGPDVSGISTGVVGQELILILISGSTNIPSGLPDIRLNADVPFAMNEGSSIHFVYVSAGSVNAWVEISRSN
ncbi:MAG: hypothetical protein AAF551_13700, partial [Bacteroidota bacterium]